MNQWKAETESENNNKKPELICLQQQLVLSLRGDSNKLKAQFLELT